MRITVSVGSCAEAGNVTSSHNLQKTAERRIIAESARSTGRGPSEFLRRKGEHAQFVGSAVATEKARHGAGSDILAATRSGGGSSPSAAKTRGCKGPRVRPSTAGAGKGATTGDCDLAMGASVGGATDGHSTNNV